MCFMLGCWNVRLWKAPEKKSLTAVSQNCLNCVTFCRRSAMQAVQDAVFFFLLLIIVCALVLMHMVRFQLERSFQRFTTFYSGRHSGRKLNWLYNMSKGEIVTNCFKNRYTLQVGTCCCTAPHHMPTLLLPSATLRSTCE